MNKNKKNVTPSALLLLSIFFGAVDTSHADSSILFSTPEIEGEYFGRSVSSTGDVNNDGYLDFIASTTSNKAYVYSGADEQILYSLTGEASEYLGLHVSGAGDVNNDGYMDFMTGARVVPYDFPINGAKLYSGIDGSVLDTCTNGGGGSYEAEHTVSAAGDVNNDGYDDFMIGIVPDTGYGGISVVNGKTMVTLYYEYLGSWDYGSSISEAGDVNNDGYADFMAGSPTWYNPNTNESTGYVKVYSGIDGSTMYEYYGDAEYDRFGYSIDSTGDVNNDGYGDLIIGTSKSNAYVKVYSGSDGSVIYTKTMSGHRAKVAGAGDINGDGYDDFMVGDYGSYNNYKGAVYIYSGKDGSTLFYKAGSLDNDTFGRSMTGLGDYNKDGYDDFAIGWFGGLNIYSGIYIKSVKDDFSNNDVAGWIWRGTSNGVEGVHRIWEPNWAVSTGNWITPSRTYPPTWDAALEYDIETTGDFNGDGDADWLWRAQGNGDGRWKVWQIENGYRSGQNNLPDYDAAHDMSVIGAGDTDKDGDDDVILKSAAGILLIWEMENHELINTHIIGSFASAFDRFRIGDFDGDNDVDLLMQITEGTGLYFAEIENNAVVSSHGTEQAGPGFKTQCSGDFDGDGDDDVYLLADTGESKFFEYENFVRQQQRFGANQSTFDFYGCADFDGDGITDTQWTTSDGLGHNRILIIDSFQTEKTYYTNRYGGTNPANPGYGYEHRSNNN